MLVMYSSSILGEACNCQSGATWSTKQKGSTEWKRNADRPLPR